MDDFFPPFSTREGRRKLTEGKEREENGEDERLSKKRLYRSRRPSIIHDYILFNRTCSPSLSCFPLSRIVRGLRDRGRRDTLP